jgi:putative membrane protein insertion efficiency factor
MRWARAPLVWAIRFYRAAISPLLPASCRFRPTCSSYALTAIERYGVLKGGWMAAKRIGRCHPWNPGGFDPVP